jgi:hypothetical protein
MPANVARTRFVFTLIHWVLVLMSVVLLGLGWYIKYIPQEPQARSFLLNIHISFGLTSAILLWGAVDATLAWVFGTVHGVLAFVLAGSIFVHVCIGTLNIFKHPGIAAPPLGAQESGELAPPETKIVSVSKLAQSLAKKLRLFGWIGFWLQFVLAFISALLLAFATTGRAFSPGSAWFGDATYWGNYGFLLLCFAVLLAFYYTRAARKVVSKPDSYFKQTNGAPFGFWYRHDHQYFRSNYILYWGCAEHIIVNSEDRINTSRHNDDGSHPNHQSH